MVRPGRSLSAGLIAPVAAVCLAHLLGAPRVACAYIDPGTGGAVFSSVAPIIAAMGLFLVGVLAFGRDSVRRALAILWRHRFWVGAVLLGAVAGAAAGLLM